MTPYSGNRRNKATTLFLLFEYAYTHTHYSRQENRSFLYKRNQFEIKSKYIGKSVGTGHFIQDFTLSGGMIRFNIVQHTQDFTRADPVGVFN